MELNGFGEYIHKDSDEKTEEFKNYSYKELW